MILGSGSGVTGKVDFNTFWQQAFAAMLATTIQNRTSAFGFHASAESKLLLAGPLGWLIGAFHYLENWLIGNRRKCLLSQQLSMSQLLYLFVIQQKIYSPLLQLFAGNPVFQQQQAGNRIRQRIMPSEFRQQTQAFIFQPHLPTKKT